MSTLLPPARVGRFAAALVAAAATVAATSTLPALADAPGHATPSAVTVTTQTYNLDLGADLTPLFRAADLTSVVTGAATVYQNVVSSKPDERMQAVARILATQRPDIVGLQEVATWQLAPYTMVGGVPVAGTYQTTFDFLASLLADLSADGVSYTAVSADVTFDSAQALPIAIPISPTQAARYIDRNVVLVRDGYARHATVTNAMHGNFTATFDVTVATIPVSVHRGWASVDVTQRGRTFRFFDTHLEAYGTNFCTDNVRNPQAVELADLVQASPYPTVVVGDLNARPSMCVDARVPPDPQDGNVVAYSDLQAAGLTEVWPLVYPSQPCSPASWTSGQDSLVGPVSTLTHRIDDVFLSTGWSALQTFVVGASAADLTEPDGLWPSDHASTVAKIRLDAAPAP